MENFKKIEIKNFKKYFTNRNALLSILITSILLWITSLMNWVTAVTGASDTVSDTADSVSSFFGLGDSSGSDALSSLDTTMTGNLWNFVSDGEKTSTSIGVIFLPVLIAVILLTFLAFSKQTKGFKIATGIVGILSSIIFLFISLGYAGVVETISQSASSSSYGLASMDFKYSIGYIFFILLALLLLIFSIITLVTRPQKIKSNNEKW